MHVHLKKWMVSGFILSIFRVLPLPKASVPSGGSFAASLIDSGLRKLIWIAMVGGR